MVGARGRRLRRQIPCNPIAVLRVAERRLRKIEDEWRLDHAHLDHEKIGMVADQTRNGESRDIDDVVLLKSAVHG